MGINVSRLEGTASQPIVEITLSKGPYPSPEEKEMIRKSWKAALKKNPSFCEILFKQVLEKSHKIRRQFDLDIELSQMETDLKFRSHAVHLKTFLGYLIQDLALEAEAVGAECEKKGMMHIVNVGPDFHPLHWNLFARCIADAMAEEISLWTGKREDLKAAWYKFTSFIIINMQDGYIKMASGSQET